MTSQQLEILRQIFSEVLAGLLIAFIAFVWRFVTAVSELPRIRKGMRLLFQRMDKIEKALGLEERDDG